MQVRFLLLALLLAIAASSVSVSQESAVPSARSAPRVMKAQPSDSRPTPPSKRPSRANSKQKGAGSQGASKPDAGKGKKSDQEEKKHIQRPDKPPKPADPKELDVRPDESGLIQFSFRGQAWPDVLDWLAGVSNMSLDWQELPSDFLNLTTQRKYTVDEARDLINRHLQARGFTLLVNGEVLSVAKVAEINPGMVPRVRAEDLAERLPNEFVKVSFQLDWLLAEQTAQELAPMKSPNGKLTALKNTNRIEAMDSVINLREIYAILQQEQSVEGESRLVQEFALLHTRATDVLDQLKELLGIESKKPAGPMTPQQLAMMRQQQQRMAQQAQRGRKPQPQQKKEPQVSLVANPRRNSILAHAPPDKMAIIRQFVDAIDVPSDRRNSLLANPGRMKVYRLHALDPETLVSTLEELGELDPTSRLDVDEKNKAIIAHASLADHLMIRQLIDQLDGSGRSFEAIRLRRLAADYVAGTVEFMMVGKKEENQNRNRYYFGWGGRNNRDEEDKDEFRVDADVENNVLLLWASKVEVEEVMNLLVKLGEIPPQGGKRTKLRVLDSISERDAARFLERLRQAWPSLAPNRLNLPEVKPEPQEEKPAEPLKPSTKGKEVRFAPRLPGVAADFDSPHVRARDLQLSRGDFLTVAMQDDEIRQEATAADEPRPSNKQAVPRSRPGGDAAGGRRRFGSRRDDSQSNNAPPPVQLSIAPDGRLVITSEDTQALDLLEELIAQISPRRPDYKVFRLKYTDAYYVKLNLEEFFTEQDENKNSRTRYYFYDYAPQQQETRLSRLSQRKKLKFIYDLDTNSILVQGADSNQLKTIEELIAIYDVPEPADSQSARISKVFAIKHSKAQAVADTVKDVFRDLLSSNDKALANNPEQKSRGNPGGTTYIFGSSGSGDSSERTQIRFKGALSVGIDELSNTLVVSTAGENLMSIVAQMIETLDQAAKPVSTVSVLQVGPGVNAAKVSEVLSKMLGEPQPAAQTDQQRQRQQQQQAQQSRRNGRGGGSNGNAATEVK